MIESILNNKSKLTYYLYSMNRSKENLRNSFKMINVKIVKPIGILKTPTAGVGCLTQRNIELKSPSSLRPQVTERKVVSIDLLHKNSLKVLEQLDEKKKLKVKKKTQSADLTSTRSGTRVKNSICLSQKKLSRKNSILNCGDEQLQCFEELNSMDLSPGKQKNWLAVVEQKKMQLYSQLYKLDKKLLTFQRDLDRSIKDSYNNKSSVMEIVKKKTCLASKKQDVHVNIYKASRLRGHQVGKIAEVFQHRQ